MSEIYKIQMNSNKVNKQETYIKLTWVVQTLWLLYQGSCSTQYVTELVVTTDPSQSPYTGSVHIQW